MQIKTQLHLKSLEMWHQGGSDDEDSIQFQLYSSVVRKSLDNSTCLPTYISQAAFLFSPLRSSSRQDVEKQKKGTKLSDWSGQEASGDFFFVLRLSPFFPTLPKIEMDLWIEQAYKREIEKQRKTFLSFSSMGWRRLYIPTFSGKLVRRTEGPFLLFVV